MGSMHCTLLACLANWASWDAAQGRTASAGVLGCMSGGCWEGCKYASREKEPGGRRKSVAIVQRRVQGRQRWSGHWCSPDLFNFFFALSLGPAPLVAAASRFFAFSFFLGRPPSAAAPRSLSPASLRPAAVPLASPLAAGASAGAAGGAAPCCKPLVSPSKAALSSRAMAASCSAT